MFETCLSKEEEEEDDEDDGGWEGRMGEEEEIVEGLNFWVELTMVGL